MMMDENAVMVPQQARKWKMPIFVFFTDASNVFKRDELGMEILRIAIPAAMALAADPIASLIDTAFIGHLGPVEIAGVGVAIAIFNQASKVAIFPLVSITTSFVAEEDTIEKINNNQLQKDESNNNIESNGSLEKDTTTTKDDQDHETKKSTCKSLDHVCETKNGRRHIPSASTALLLGSILGLLLTLFLIRLGETLLGFMGVKSHSAGDITNIILDPIFIFVFRMGVSGAAIAHVLSQYLICLILLVKLTKQVDLLPPSIQDLQFSKFLKNGFLLLARVIAATICVTLAASMAARLGPTSMAAFQICLQVWMTSSLLADGLAVAGQAILACAFAEKDYQKATAAAARVLQMGFVLGLGLALFVGLGLQFGSGIFTKDQNVIHMIAIGIPFVSATQPINSLAFVFDGVNFGASDFAYSAYSMVLVSIVSIGSLFVLSKTNGFVGIWLALTIYMGLRTFAGFWRMGTGTGPWQFLKSRRSSPSNNI
ncbi:hypothetical protein CASFOL_005912 [Castilleja foliolosa]|uniref:Protein DETOXIFICATION n=1 Tax=Castilleja foliolosa TaxID=1961234 RepID=A0ABD3E8S3_9LAMI